MIQPEVTCQTHAKFAPSNVNNLCPGVSMQTTGGEAIPREYHRRVLKKIAQLTKVRIG